MYTMKYYFSLGYKQDMMLLFNQPEKNRIENLFSYNLYVID